MQVLCDVPGLIHRDFRVGLEELGLSNVVQRCRRKSMPLPPGPCWVWFDAQFMPYVADSSGRWLCQKSAWLVRQSRCSILTVTDDWRWERLDEWSRALFVYMPKADCPQALLILRWFLEYSQAVADDLARPRQPLPVEVISLVEDVLWQKDDGTGTASLVTKLCSATEPDQWGRTTGKGGRLHRSLRQQYAAGQS